MSQQVFWVIKCPQCGRYQSCWPTRPRSYTFNCRRCGHSTKLWKQSTQGIGLHHKIVRTGAVDAARVCAELNKRSRTNEFEG